MNMLALLKTPWVQRGVISVALLGAVALWVDPGEVMQEVRRLSPWWVVLALGISVLQVMLSAWRWRFTAGLLGVPLRFRYALREYYLALLINQLVPGGVVGDAGRAHRHARQTGSRGSAWRAVVLERASGQVAVALLVVVALALSPLWHQALGATGLLVAITMLMGVAAIVALLVAWLGRAGRSWLPRWCFAFGRDLRRSLLRRRVWYWQLCSSLAIVMSYGLVMVCAARAIGVELATVDILALTPPLLLAMLVPLSIAGWGLREGAAASVWLFVGLPSAQGVAISLAYGVLVMLSSLPGIWVAFGRRHRATPVGGGETQIDVEKRVVSTAKGTHPWTQCALQRRDRRHLKARAARADQKRRHQKVQAIERFCLHELGDGDATPFDQYAPVTAASQQGDHRRRVELASVVQRQFVTDSMVFWQREAGAGEVQRGRRRALEQGKMAAHTPARVEHDPRRVSAAHVAHCELRVIGAGGAGAHHDGICQRPQTMQMDQRLETVDIVGVAAFGGDAAIEALAELGQRPGFAPGQRQQTLQQRGGVVAYRHLARPAAFIAGIDGRLAFCAVANGQQPAPGGIHLDSLALGRETRNTNGVGHDVLSIRPTLNHARAEWPTQAHTARYARQSGGLHVPH
ncbi:flippase-like domain-containing protein [Halomonas malpeensis]|uniref:Flippase-like domain-containing protein n=1 Tax=Vreelandella malpeensis TaxID=1172368 RepID=A0ABS8DPC4_9GAMM|nr:flippase-like domain-containing protein [Halomonas malpeensis]